MKRSTTRKMYHGSWALEVKAGVATYRARARNYGGHRTAIAVVIPADAAMILGIIPGDEVEVTVKRVMENEIQA